MDVAYPGRLRNTPALHNSVFERSMPSDSCSQRFTILNALAPMALRPSYFLRPQMRDYTFKEKARITAGAVVALVIVGWLAVFALAMMAAG